MVCADVSVQWAILILILRVLGVCRGLWVGPGEQVPQADAGAGVRTRLGGGHIGEWLGPCPVGSGRWHHSPDEYTGLRREVEGLA